MHEPQTHLATSLYPTGTSRGHRMGATRRTHRHRERLIELDLRGSPRICQLGRAEQIEKLLEQAEVLPRDVGHLENGAQPLRLKAARRVHHVLLRLDQHRHFLASRRLENAVQQFERGGEDVGRAHVNLGHDHEDGLVERQCQTQVLFGHADNAGVCADQKHHERRHVTRQTKHGRLEILLVPGEIDECQHFRRVAADLCPVEFAIVAWFVHNLSLGREPENIERYSARSATLGLVGMFEQFLSTFPTAIVQFVVRQHAQQCTLASIDVADHSDANVHKVIPGGCGPDKYFSNFSILVLPAFQLDHLCIKFFCYASQRVKRLVDVSR
eukprot:m.1286139 g.1286139  ORF g.1286139 m.1286139 type:complete len:327 (-) comp24780_c0_seq74:488-1468(-)